MPMASSELLLRLKDGLSGPAKIATQAMERLNKAVASSVSNRSGFGLGGASAAMKRQADDMARSVRSMERSTHAFGTALAGLGVGHEFGEFIKAGADYRKELIALQNSGKSSVDIAKSMKAAGEIATSLPTQTFADSIKIINETTAAYGDLGHALENLKFNSKFESNMKSVLGDHADPHMLQNMVRALEIRGTAFNPEKYQEETDKLGKAFAFTRGAVNPENFYDFAKNSNPDIKDFSTEFLTEVVPSLIQTFQAPGAGTGLKALEKVWRGGLTDKGQAAEWVRVGLVSAKAVQDNKGQSPGWKSGAAMFSAEAKANPFEAMGLLLKQLQKKGVDIFNKAALGLEFDKLFKNGKARAMAYELGQQVTRKALTKDAGLIRASNGTDASYEANKDDIYKARDAVKASFENLMASMSGPLMTSAAHGLWSLAQGIQGLAVTLNAHPLLGKVAGLTVTLGTAAAGVTILRSGFMMLGLTGIRPFRLIGDAMLSMRGMAVASAAFMGRSFLTLLNPLALVRGALTGIRMVTRGIVAATGIGLLILAGTEIYENWDNIGVAFEAFRGAFMRAIKPVQPILQPIIDDISRLWETVTSLIQPTGDMGAKWAQVGIHLGTVLGKDLVPWAASIRGAYEEVKTLGRHWSDIVAIITSDDPIGRAVSMMKPTIDGFLADTWASVKNYDWGAAWRSFRDKADPVLTEFFTGWVQYAEKGAQALMSYDWVGLGVRIVQAIIQGIQSLAGELAKAITDRLPTWAGGTGGGGAGGGGGARLGDRARGGSGAWKGNYGQAGWWTADRESHAVDRLMREGGLTETGAKAMVARWKYVESPGGPTAVNPTSGAEGFAQWLGSRKGGGSNGSADDQIGKVIRELNGAEAHAKEILNTPGREAEGASAFERAEGYGKGVNAGTDRDNFTARTAGGISHIHHGAAPSTAGAGTPVPSSDAVTDADVFAARQRIIKGSRDPKDREVIERYRANQAKPVAPSHGRQPPTAAPVHISNHFYDAGELDERQLAGHIADNFHRHAHAGAAGNFADVG